MYMYIPTIAPQTQYSKIGGLIAGIYKSLTDAWMQKLGIRLHNFISGNICFEFRCSVSLKTSFSPQTNIRSAILLAKVAPIASHIVHISITQNTVGTFSSVDRIICNHLCVCLFLYPSLCLSPYLFMSISVYLYFITLRVRLPLWLLSANLR